MKNLNNKIKKNKLILLGLLTILIILFLFHRAGKPDTVKPVRKNIVDAVYASGHTVNSDEYIVATKTEGYVQKCFINEGDSVEVGDLIFQLSSDVQSSQLENAIAIYEDAKFKASPESPQIITQKMKIEQAETQVEQDRRNLERYMKLIESDAVSKIDYEKTKLQYEASVSELEVLKKSLEDLMSSLQLSLENAKTQLEIQEEYYRDYFIESTIKGIVLNIFKEQGELAKRGESLALIGSGKTIAKLFIAEEDINYINIGQKTKIALNTDRENPVDALISKIYPSFDFTEQSFILEAEFVEEEKLFANTQLQANIIIAEKENVLVIPSQYLIEGYKVTLSNNTIVAVDVGIRSGNWVEILSGLDESSSLKTIAE